MMKNRDITPENALLRNCARINAGNKLKNIEEILSSDLNWGYILQESIREGITCLLYSSLSQFKDKIPENIWSDFKQIYYTNAQQNILAYQKLNRVFVSFNKENIKVIPLKGVFLAEKIYENIALRGMTDIDLLVKKEDLAKIDEVLGNLGYVSPINKELLSASIKKSYLNSMDYFKKDEKFPYIHLHWHIVNVSLPTYLYSENIEMRRFWECATPVKIGDAQTLQLAPHHLILYLSEHALKHSFDRLILLSDINEVIKKYKEKIDWEELTREAKEFGMERQVFYGLYFTNYFLGTAIPNDILSVLKPKKTNFLEKSFFYAILNNNRRTRMSYLVYLTMVRGVTNKLKFVFRTFFPPPSALALFFNLKEPKVTLKDYLLFLRKQFFHLKTVPKGRVSRLNSC